MSKLIEMVSDKNPFAWQDQYEAEMARMQEQITDLRRIVKMQAQCITLLMYERNQAAYGPKS